ncbi:hypothetical protein V2J09_005743 [Rumex salicifolius]
MGRGKLAFELINNAKARNLAFQKRKMSLKKKAYELSTLCDVPVCVLVYSPDHPPDSEPPLIYPENRDEAQSIINRYLAIPPKGENRSKRRSLDLHDVVQQGNIKRRRVDDSTASNPDCPNLVASNLDGLNGDQLCNMVSVLDQKLQFVQNRIAGFENYLDPDFGFFWS